MRPSFEPSSWMLGKMIESAEAKFAASRERAFRERFDRACAINIKSVSAERESDCRRYVNVGQKP